MQDVSGAQEGAIRRLIDIIDEPLSGDVKDDYFLRQNQIEAANVLLRVKTRMMRELADAGTRPVSFPMPKLERPEDIPRWMMEETAARYSLGSQPRLPLDHLRNLRLEIDALLNFLQPDSNTEEAVNEAARAAGARSP